MPQSLLLRTIVVMAPRPSMTEMTPPRLSKASVVVAPSGSVADALVLRQGDQRRGVAGRGQADLLSGLDGHRPGGAEQALAAHPIEAVVGDRGRLRRRR